MYKDVSRGKPSSPIQNFYPEKVAETSKTYLSLHNKKAHPKSQLLVQVNLKFMFMLICSNWGRRIIAELTHLLFRVFNEQSTSDWNFKLKLNTRPKVKTDLKHISVL